MESGLIFLILGLVWLTVSGYTTFLLARRNLRERHDLFDTCFILVGCFLASFALWFIILPAYFLKESSEKAQRDKRKGYY